MARLPEIQEQGFSLDVGLESTNQGQEYITQGVQQFANAFEQVAAKNIQQNTHNNVMDAQNEMTKEYNDAVEFTKDLPPDKRKAYMAKMRKRQDKKIKQMNLPPSYEGVLRGHQRKSDTQATSNYLINRRKTLMAKSEHLGERAALESVNSTVSSLENGADMRDSLATGVAGLGTILKGAESISDPDVRKHYIEQHDKALNSYMKGIEDWAITNNRQLDLSRFLDYVAKVETGADVDEKTGEVTPRKGSKPQFEVFKRFAAPSYRREFNKTMAQSIKTNTKGTVKSVTESLRDSLNDPSNESRSQAGNSYFNELKKLHFSTRALKKSGEIAEIQNDVLVAMSQSLVYAKASDPFDKNQVLGTLNQKEIVENMEEALGQKLNRQQRNTVLNSARLFKAEMANANAKQLQYNAYGIAKENWPDKNEKQIQNELRKRGLHGVMSGDDFEIAINNGSIIGMVPFLKKQGTLPGLIRQTGQMRNKGSKVALAHIDGAIADRVTGPSFQEEFPINFTAKQHMELFKQDTSNKSYGWMDDEAGKGASDLAQKVSAVPGYEGFYGAMMHSSIYSMMKKGIDVETAVKLSRDKVNSFIKDNYETVPGIGTPVRKYPNNSIPRDRMYNFIQRIKQNPRKYLHNSNFVAGGRVVFQSGLSTGEDFKIMIKSRDRKTGRDKFTDAIDKDGNFIFVDRNWIIRNVERP
jgi:hypothetical protein